MRGWKFAVLSVPVLLALWAHRNAQRRATSKGSSQQRKMTKAEKRAQKRVLREAKAAAMQAKAVRTISELSSRLTVHNDAERPVVLACFDVEAWEDRPSLVTEVNTPHLIYCPPAAAGADRPRDLQQWSWERHFQTPASAYQ